ncbi:hypothetical protein [Treponema pedis]|uniref:hypothetical protein n=1 Tax=Treponema pedis TaxID=409322 RepID=UPI000467C062|nr:hypothetical protein [Treponema pedis]
MTCNEALNRYMALDKHDPVPFTVTVHLLRCKRCRNIVRAMTTAACMYSRALSDTADSDDKLVQKTMDKINKTLPDLVSLRSESTAPNVHILPWVIIGITMIIGLGSVPFTEIGRWASENFQLKFVIPFALVFASFVSIFSALFVGRNLDFFVKKFDLKDGN